MRPRSVRFQLLLAVALPSLGALALVALLAGALARGEARLDEAHAWHAHALSVGELRAASSAVTVDLEHLAEGGPAAQLALGRSLVELERAIAGVRLLSPGLEADQVAVDQRVVSLAADLAGGARALAARAAGRQPEEAAALLLRLEPQRLALDSLLRQHHAEEEREVEAERLAASADARRQLLAAAAVALAALGLGVLPAIWLVRRLRRDVAALEAAAERVGRRDFGPVVLEGAGGLSDLAGAFDRMAEELRRHERQAAQVTGAQRLAALGTVSAGVVHELNGPLAYVSANLGAAAGELDRLLPPDGLDPERLARRHEFLQALLEARAGCQRMAAIVRDVKTLSRPDAGEARPVALSPVLDAAINVARAAVPRRLQVRFDRRDASPPAVAASEPKLGQVVLNLVLNAVQAVEATGRGEGTVTVSAGAEGPDLAVIEVADDGVGMPPEVVDRLFEPFFTTRAELGGTGLGLSVCQGIVAGLGGTLSVRSLPGCGTTFRVLLPCAGRAPASHPGVPAAAPGAGPP